MDGSEIYRTSLCLHAGALCCTEMDVCHKNFFVHERENGLHVIRHCRADSDDCSFVQKEGTAMDETRGAIQKEKEEQQTARGGTNDPGRANETAKGGTQGPSGSGSALAGTLLRVSSTSTRWHSQQLVGMANLLQKARRASRVTFRTSAVVFIQGSPLNALKFGVHSLGLTVIAF